MTIFGCDEEQIVSHLPRADPSMSVTKQPVDNAESDDFAENGVNAGEEGGTGIAWGMSRGDTSFL